MGLPAKEMMLNTWPVIQIDYSGLPDGRLRVNGREYNIITRGFFTKQQCLLDTEGAVWLTIKKRGINTLRLVFANGNKYQMEVLSYASLSYIFYDQEDTELFRLSVASSSPDTIRLLVSADYLPEEEFMGLIVWGFYCWRNTKGKQNRYKPAA